MRKYYECILFICVLFVPMMAGGQGKAPLAYTDFFKAGMEKVDGVLPVYQSEDKYYLEIPTKLLGREILFSGVMVQGGGVVQALTPALGVAIFKAEPQNRVSLSKGILGERVSDTTSVMYRMMKERVLEPVDVLYTIVAFGPDGTSPIIEITSQIKSSPEWFGHADKGALDASKSAVLNVGKISDGVKFLVKRVHSFSQPGFMGVPGKEGIMQFEMAYMIRVLPEKEMAVRYADPRVGYQTLSYLDFGNDPQGVEKMSIIYKWNLSVRPQDEALLVKNQLVEPEKPIVFYISPEVPERFRPAIRKGILEWQAAFEQAGFKNALQVKDASASVDLSLADAVISCSPKSGDVTSSLTVNPRTGEILNCRVNVPYYFVQSAMKTYLVQCGAVDERVIKDPASEELVLNLLRSKVAAEMGNVFGLLPNFGASAAFVSAQMRDPKWMAENGYSVSVMNGIPFAYAVQPGDGVDVNDLMPRVGSYDRWAIMWGYKQHSATPDAEKDRKALIGLCDAVKRAKVLRYTGFDKLNPLGIRNNLGCDRVVVAELGMKNLERIYPRLDEITAKTDGSSWNELEDMYKQVHFQYNEYLKSAGSFVAGRYTALEMRESDEKTVSYVTRKEQKEAMDFLNRYLFAGVPAWYENEICKKNGWIEAGEMSKRFADSWLKEKLDAESVNILLAGEAADGNRAYTVNAFFADLDKMIFNDYKVSGVTSVYQKNMQYGYVKGMLEGLQKGQANQMVDDYGIVMTMQARKMVERLEQLGKSHSDIAERIYFQSLAAQLKKSL